VQSFLFGHNRSYWTSFDQAYRPVFQFSGPRYKRHDYDPAGNLKSLTDINNTAQSFDYSPLNEITSASDTQAGSYGSLAYSYLPNGNRQNETRNGTATTYYYYDNTNRLYHAGDSDWRLMDAAGNTTWSNALWGISYDGYGRLLSSSKAQSSYGYNVFNQRTTKSAGGATTSFLYGQQGELLYETNGASTKAYVYFNGIPLARIDNNTDIYYYHTDHLGTPQAMTNSGGATVWKASYEPFGKATVTTQTITNNLRFPGQYFDQETGLHYNWHRYYDPKIGRYISSDPIGLAGGLNTYTYALNNPLRYIDPFGLETLGIGIEPPIASAIVNGVLNPAEDPGHTFLYLMNDKDQVTNVLSVGPSSPIGALNKNSFLNGTLGAVSNWSITGQVSAYEWDITSKQYAQCQKTLNQMKKNPGNYSPTNQCTSAAISAAKQCGVNVPSGISPVQVPPIPLIFKGYSNNLPNPYGLQQQLNKSMTPKIVPDSTFTIQ
ncbi:MAG: RHS domain-containing protein, partial [Candidatus Berkelbacteria bacterium]|nr:RHS domain-containing protein [Candidatus Berkelbacteria bacterium]